jgi:mRNA interferase MazF
VLNLTGAKPKAKKSGSKPVPRTGVYQPDRGDFVYLNFTPQSGTERAGLRPALVLSPLDFNIATGLMFVCPITKQEKAGSFDVAVPRGAKLEGYILSHQMRTVDWIAGDAEFHSKAPEVTVLEVLARIEAILQIALDP